LSGIKLSSSAALLKDFLSGLAFIKSSFCFDELLGELLSRDGLLLELLN
jgi:hypothetical protein